MSPTTDTAPPAPTGRHRRTMPIPPMPIGPPRSAPHSKPSPQLARRLRHDLLTGAASAPADCNGPTASDALYWLHLIGTLASQLGTLTTHISSPDNRPIAGDAHAACGHGARHALHVLHRAVTAVTTWHSDTPQPQRQPINGREWAHATCAVRAEAALCAETVTATGHTTAPLRELHRLTGEFFQLYTRMARHPAFLAWHAGTDPLYAAWLDGPLSSATAPHQLYEHSTALYAAHPALPAPDTTAWPAPMHAAPAGQIQRHVPDRTGRHWALILAPDAVPATAQLPGHHTVIAAHAPYMPGATSCYVLAEQVPAHRAWPVLATEGSPASLEATAAALLPAPAPTAVPVR